MSDAQSAYYVPEGSALPFVGTVGLFVLFAGFGAFLNGASAGSMAMLLGFAILAVMIFGWFGAVIRESEAGLYNAQVDRTYRWSMAWFIFSEVAFFAAFFGALYYVRTFSVPWLGGLGSEALTGQMLHPTFEAIWPTNGPAKLGGDFEAMGAWGLPALNTAILLSSGATVTWAHWGLLKNNRTQFTLGLALTVILGVVFIGFQATEYAHGFSELNLTLESGVYGSTFYMLTGFHGLHVSIGAIMLAVIFFRALKGHFTPDNHFAFEAVAWYWHFVDVVWLGLFIFVYWL